MPLVRGIYGSLKQIFETVLSNKGDMFRQVGLVEYPRKGVWSLVFVASEKENEINEKLDQEGDPLIAVFMPCTPNPTTGFLMYVPKSDIVLLDMTIEDGAKLIVSAGLVAPEVKSKVVVAEWRADRGRACQPVGWRLGSAGAQEPHGLVAAEQVKQQAQRLAPIGLQLRVAGQDQPGVVAGGLQKVGMRLDARHLETRRAGLAGAQQLAFAAQLQILLGDQEAVLGLAHDRQSALGRLAKRVLVEQHAGGLARRRARHGRAAGAIARGQSARHVR